MADTRKTILFENEKRMQKKNGCYLKLKILGVALPLVYLDG